MSGGRQHTGSEWMRSVPWMNGPMTPCSHAVFLLVAEHGRAVALRKAAADVQASHRTLVVHTWSHTPLQAMKVDKGLTCLQTGLAAGQHLARTRAQPTSSGPRRRWSRPGC